MRSGYGKQYFKDGSKYEGEWMNDTPNGKGIFYYPDGDIYDGGWKND